MVGHKRTSRWFLIHAEESVLDEKWGTIIVHTSWILKPANAVRAPANATHNNTSELDDDRAAPASTQSNHPFESDDAACSNCNHGYPWVSPKSIESQAIYGSVYRPTQLLLRENSQHFSSSHYSNDLAFWKWSIFFFCFIIIIMPEKFDYLIMSVSLYHVCFTLSPTSSLYSRSLALQRN